MWCDFLCHHELIISTFKWTELLNEFLIKLIYFSCDFRCDHRLHTFTSKQGELLKDFFIKMIYPSRDIHCCYHLHTLTTTWCELLNRFLLKTAHVLCDFSCCHESHTTHFEVNSIDKCPAYDSYSFMIRYSILSPPAHIHYQVRSIVERICNEIYSVLLW